MCHTQQPFLLIKVADGVVRSVRKLCNGNLAIGDAILRRLRRACTWVVGGGAAVHYLQRCMCILLSLEVILPYSPHSAWPSIRLFRSY